MTEFCRKGSTIGLVDIPHVWRSKSDDWILADLLKFTKNKPKYFNHNVLIPIEYDTSLEERILLFPYQYSIQKIL